MSAENGLSKEGWTEVFGSNYVKELYIREIIVASSPSYLTCFFSLWVREGGLPGLLMEAGAGG